ncbi:SHOCT domain-containing protein [Microbacterium sp. 4R-513]|uniref:SHOCT domain-containing protein n=1 Tax=Microbacterium sp. 4R-513 TaxID=2567934 RepID=UPI0013E16241|nr:SHOCT domain-containing protein [Microbacterium sp. 4R-513]QIG40734.1 SHOCT domain-containing protein [Microbacterium sp. 4R-513]
MFFWWLLWFFYFAAYLYVIIFVIRDLFRDHKANGWIKALWIILLIFVPFLTGLIYVIVNGKGIAEREYEARRMAPENDSYTPQASSSPSEDIARAKALLDAGTISQGEFDALKSKALGNQYFGA